MSFQTIAFTALCCLSALLPVPVAVHAATGEEARNILRLPIRFEAPGACRISIGAQTFAIPDEEDAVLAALKPLLVEGRRVSIVGGVGIPYRCIGQTIYTAQRAGFAKVSFIADPPSDE